MERNTLWAMVSSNVAYWDGSEWRRPSGPRLIGGVYLANFFGGGRQPLYCSQGGDFEHHGEIYRLSDGVAEYVTGFHCDSASDLDLYLSHDGRFFNWGKQMLAVYDHEVWTKVELPGTEADPLVFDTGKTVYFFYPTGLLCAIGQDNCVRKIDVPLETEEQEWAHVRGARWGEYRALLITRYGAQRVVGFELSSGKILDLAATNQQLEGVRIWDLFRAWDGSVWLITSGASLADVIPRRVSPDGKVEVMEELTRFEWRDFAQWISRCPRSVLRASDGAVWFGRPERGIVCYRGRRAREFDGRNGLALTSCHELWEDGRGTIYAASSHGIYVRCARGAPERELPEPRRPSLPEDVLWIHRPAAPLKQVWRIEDRICYIDPSKSQLQVLDAATGQLWKTIALDRDVLRYLWISPGRVAGEIELSTLGKILYLDLTSGEIVDQVLLRGAPVPVPTRVEDDYLVVPKPRDYCLNRAGRDGEVIWSCKLTGYPLRHPAVCGDFAVVQTRQSSYGGQATTGINVHTGDVVWTDRTDAYGGGIVFGDGGTYLIETDRWLSPEVAEARIIRRDLKTGRREWEIHREPGASGPALLDPKTGQVFAITHRGCVACLDGRDGKVVWESRLPESAHGPISDWVGRDQSLHSLQEGRLLVVDVNKVLHILDPAEGTLLDSLALAAGFRGDEKGLPPVEILAPPWLEGNRLIVACRTGVIAYSLDTGDAEPAP
jgi:outer membrane protein assembly factor BamB